MMDSSEGIEPTQDQVARCRGIQETERRLRDYREMLKAGEKMINKVSPQDMQRKIKSIETEMQKLTGMLLTFGSCSIVLCPVHQPNPDPKPNIKHNSNEIISNESDSSESGFIQPTKKKTAKIVENPTAPKETPVSNQFDPLNGQIDKVDKSKEEGLPPIIFMKINDNYKTDLKNLNDLIPNLRSKLNGDFIKLLPDNHKSHQDITNYLKFNKIPAHQKIVNQTKISKFVIKGLPVDTDSNEIKTELAEKGFPSTEITQFKRKNGQNIAIFQIVINKTPEVDKIKEINRLCCMAIKIENYNRRMPPPQWFNCNGFFHKSNQCLSEPRCLKCGLNHPTAKCQIKEKLEKPTCINCNMEGHTAAWTKCPKYLQNSNVQKPNRATPNRSYAKVTTPQTVTQKEKTESPKEVNLIDEIREMMSVMKTFMEIFNGVGNLKEILNKTTNAMKPSEKLRLISIEMEKLEN